MIDTALISFQDVTKSFGAVCANQHVSFDIHKNSFHGIIGENGAGKSTIMRMLYGMFSPDSGEIFLQGERVHFKSPNKAIARGIGMVHQHFMLVPTLTVWENIVLGDERSFGVLKKKALIQTIDQLQRDFGFSLNLENVIEDLALGEKQQVEILKLLYRKSDVLILDEPTALLTPTEATHLFERLKLLQTQGKTIVLISHKLREILDFCERFTVMRKGTVVGTFETGGLSEAELAQTLLGRQPRILKKAIPPRENTSLLNIQKVSTTPLTGVGLNQLSLSVRSHEIVGIAGIEGQGQEELVRILAQLHPFEGSIELLGEPLHKRKRYQNRQNGFGIIPPDRHEDGLILNFSAADNLILGAHRELPFYSKGIRQSQAIEAHAQHQFTQFEINPRNTELPASAFSGGNQQKLVVSRETNNPLRFLLACHPTRGVDLGAMEHIHQHLLEMVTNGLGVLLISSDLDELLKLSHRVLVLRQGTIVYQEQAEEIIFSDLGLWMTGARK